MLQSDLYACVSHTLKVCVYQIDSRFRSTIACIGSLVIVVLYIFLSSVMTIALLSTSMLWLRRDSELRIHDIGPSQCCDKFETSVIRVI